MSSMKLLFMFFCSVLSIAPVSAHAQDVLAAEESARRLATAMEQCDATRVVELLTPQVVGLMEGKPAAVKLLAAEYADGQSIGMKTSVKLGAATEVGRAQGRLFRFIPYLIKFSVVDREPIMNHSFFVAVSDDNGKTWFFFEGAGLKSHLGKTLLPNYDGNPPTPEPLPLSAYR